MFEQYKRKLCLRGNILSGNTDFFYKKYKRKESISGLFIDLLELLKEDLFLVLNPSLITELRDVITSFLFYFPKDDFLHDYWRKIMKELIRQENMIMKNRDTFIQNMIEKERIERNIPDFYCIGINELIEMYKFDFNNCIAMEHQYISLEENQLFYYLSTVNKIYKYYPDNVKMGRLTIRFMILKLQYNSVCDEDLQNYIDATENVFSEKRKEKKFKMIEFPK